MNHYLPLGFEANGEERLPKGFLSVTRLVVYTGRFLAMPGNWPEMQEILAQYDWAVFTDRVSEVERLKDKSKQ